MTSGKNSTDTLYLADPAGAGPEDTIFVSIAAYRDPQLSPTIEDCLAKARWPDRLRFGICWQHGPDETPLERFGDPRFRVLDVDWRKSRGACWARAEIMEMWDHERWFLQLDSHHRFVPDWDAKLLAQMSGTGSPKPILSTYPGSFVPDEDPASFSDVPSQMCFRGFSEDGMILLMPRALPGWPGSTVPMRSRFVAAGFLFAPGCFVTDVPYDPNLYFLGEEITLAVRAFTNGYDLFHPGEVIMWHEYERINRPKHWSDHTDDRGVGIDWGQRDARSRTIVRRLLTAPHPGRFGIGTERSLADYEAYSGISFAHRRVQDYARRHLEPPNLSHEADWMSKTEDHTVRITIRAWHLPLSVWEESKFWYVGAHDKDGQEIFRSDADAEEVSQLLEGRPKNVTLVREFQSTAGPATWTVIPYIESEGWLDPIKGELLVDSYGNWESATIVLPTIDSEALEPANEPWANIDLTDCFPEVAVGLTWSETEGGFVVNRAYSPTPFVINGTGVLILELANGRYSVPEIIEVVQEAYGLAKTPRAQVMEFLRSASICGLVHPSGTQQSNDVSGTEMIKLETARPDGALTPRHRSRRTPRWNTPDDVVTDVAVTGLLASWVRVSQPEVVVETGTYLGDTAEAIGHALSANGHGVLFTHEIDRSRWEHASSRLQGLPVECVLCRGTDWEPSGPIGLAWFDSACDARAEEIAHYLPFMASGSVFAVPDTGPHDSALEQVEAVVSGLAQFRLRTQRGVSFFQVP